MRILLAAVLVAAILLVTGCAPAAQATLTAIPPTPSSTHRAVLRYVALGDSYTIGTGVGREDRWPDQLVERLNGEGIGIELVANLAVNGYTSADLIADELPQVDPLRPDLASVLIGVNDVVQRVPGATYRANVQQILAELLGSLPRDRIFVISTPDYTRTPRGADFGDREAQRAAIADVNRIMREETSQRGIEFVEIGAVADRAGEDRDLVATDLLHPSGAQYALWVDLIQPVVTQLLEQSAE